MACIDDVLVHASEEKEGIDSIFTPRDELHRRRGELLHRARPSEKEYAKSKLKNIEVFAFDDDCSIPECERGKGGARGLCGTLLGLESDERFAKREGGFRRCEKSPRDFGRTRRRTGFRWVRCDAWTEETRRRGGTGRDGRIRLGIHNEPGFKTVPFESAEKTVEIALDAIEKALELESEKAKRNSAVSGVGIMGKIDHMLGLDAETKMSIGLVKSDLIVFSGERFRRDEQSRARFTRQSRQTVFGEKRR